VKGAEGWEGWLGQAAEGDKLIVFDLNSIYSSQGNNSLLYSEIRFKGWIFMTPGRSTRIKWNRN